MQVTAALVLVRLLLAPDPDLISLVHLGDTRGRAHELLGEPELFVGHGPGFSVEWFEGYAEHTVSCDPDGIVYEIDGKPGGAISWPGK